MNADALVRRRVQLLKLALLVTLMCGPESSCHAISRNLALSYLVTVVSDDACMYLWNITNGGGLQKIPIDELGYS